jgi:hypothetical protein
MQSIVPSFFLHFRDNLFFPSLISSLLVFVVMKYADDRFTNKSCPFGQVSFQFAFTESRAREMVMSWNKEETFWVFFSLIFGKSTH